MKRSWRVVASVAALALVGGLAACGSDDDDKSSDDTTNESTESGGETGETKDKIKVGFVYIGPAEDGGWTGQHDIGREELEEALGDQVEVTVLESVPEGAEGQRAFEDLARNGNDLIFGTSFGYMDPMLAVAEANPDVCFQHATGYKTADNMGTYFGAAEEARYLSGIAAGAASESGKIGYVAAFPIPEVIRGINAFTLGAQSVNPDATVQVVWTKTWFGPDEEKQAAQSLVDAGVDVLAQHQDTTATGEAANEAGAKWSGYNADQSAAFPDAWLTGPVWDWGPYYIQTAQAVLDGTCPTDQYYGNMADGMVTLAPFGESVDADTEALIEDTKAKIIDGSFAPFTGPITDQDGEVRIADGEVAPLDDLLGMDYFVAGVEGDPAG